MLATTLGVALDTYLFAEPSRPMFVEVNTPFRRDRRWGGDNTDAYYHMCPVAAKRRYRIAGNKGDSVYFSVTAYNEPSPGTWSDRIVAIVGDDDLDIDEAGNFSFELGPTPDAAVLMTRDYQADPLTGRPVSWRIEALDEPESVRHGDAETAAALRASGAWLRTRFAIVPLAVGFRVDDSHRLGHEIAQVANQFADPYQVPDANFGWSARDACSAYGSFVLEHDEALVITHRPPKCRFWNLVVWNQFMATHNVNDARSSVNGHSAVPNADGFDHGRYLPWHDSAPEFFDHTGLSAGQSRLQVVPRRRGTRPTGRAVGEGVRRADECRLNAPTSTPWLFRRRNHSPQAELGDIRTCVTAFSSGVTCSPHRRCSRS
jgi:hypothetical protein